MKANGYLRTKQRAPMRVGIRGEGGKKANQCKLHKCFLIITTNKNREKGLREQLFNLLLPHSLLLLLLIVMLTLFLLISHDGESGGRRRPVCRLDYRCSRFCFLSVFPSSFSWSLSDCIEMYIMRFEVNEREMIHLKKCVVLINEPATVLRMEMDVRNQKSG